jgi:hypothetical protein
MWLPVLALLLLEAVIQVGSESPYCDLLLNIQNIDAKLGWNPSNCTVHTYKITDVVDCFDEMLQNQERWMHFAFIGDSRIRYQFYSFLEVRQTILIFNFIYRLN